MINFGSAAEKYPPSLDELIARYKGPREHLTKILNTLNQIRRPSPLNPAASERKTPESQVKKGPPQIQKRPSLHRQKSSDERSVSPYESSHINWDLVISPPEKLMPNWDLHESIPDTLNNISAKTLKQLTRHEIIEYMPTTPTPRQVAIFNILRKKMGRWEKAEEDLYRKRQGWYCANRHVNERTWISWTRTQNRDFGSAVWRWLRLGDWDRTQSSRMKGLFDFILSLS
jgi:hypothetical protein